MNPTIDLIKEKIDKIYKADPHIHVTVNMTHPKVNASLVPALIIGVYTNMFRIEENESGYTSSHSIKYTDVLIGKVKIMELEL